MHLAGRDIFAGRLVTDGLVLGLSPSIRSPSLSDGWRMGGEDGLGPKGVFSFALENQSSTVIAAP